MDQSLYSVSCDLRTRPGKVTARRLNRAEYNRTVRDLFGLDRFEESIQPADRFPSDEVGEGFDNNSDVLSMSPLLMEKYLAAAETIAELVVVDPEAFPSVDLQQTADQFLFHGEVAVGKYRGHCVSPETKAWVTFSTPIAELLVPRKSQDEIDLKRFPLMIRKLSLEGPTEFPASVFPPTQFEIVRKKAYRNSEIDPYIDLVVDATERGESYHRGIQIALTAILVSPNFLFRIETPPGNSAENPAENHSETEPPSTSPVVALTQHQLASRLSYFLFSSMPDQKLMDTADRGKLVGRRLENEVQRMLGDPKSFTLASQFAAQWLGLKNLDTHEPDTDKFPMFSTELTKAMSIETQQLFSHVVSMNRPVVELLTADYSFLNPLLAQHYGIDIEANRDAGTGQLTGQLTEQKFVRVSLADSPRRGLLSHASVLTLTSNPGRTSPVKRGKWILENVLGTPPPDPPPGTPKLEDAKTSDEHASLREQLEQYRADPACAACHRVMDQLGFGLEQFDAVGQFRGSDGENAFDSSGELPDGRRFDSGRELSEVLGETEVDSFANTVISRLMTFAVGRGLSPGDRCVIDEIAEETRGRGY